MTTVRRPVGKGVLIRYRVLAYVTAVLLLPLVFVATPLDLWSTVKWPATVLGIAHGWLYMLYVVFAFEIAVKLKLPLSRMLLVVLAGTIPFGAFFAERYVTRAWRRFPRPPAGERVEDDDHVETARGARPTVQ
jgi:integral membrane protein